jgi:hypothetical protein
MLGQIRAGSTRPDLYIAKNLSKGGGKNLSNCYK